MSDFKRENRYIVIKLSRLNDNQILRNQQLNELNFFSDAFVESVVVEADKPEYEHVWAMVQARIEGRKNKLEERRIALNLMITYFGMDENDSNKEVFDSARKALADTQASVKE